MKCPKCHYVSFDPEPRCRNCGYTLDFDPDLVINRVDDASHAAPADLELRSDAPTPVRLATSHPSARDADGAGDVFPEEAKLAPPTPPRRVVRDPPRQIPVTPRVEPKASRTPAPVAPPRPKREPAPPTGELPLFVKRVPPEPVETPDALEEASPGPPEASQPAAAPRSPRREVPVDPPIVTPPAPAPVASIDNSADRMVRPEPIDDVPDDDPLLELPIVTPPPLSVRRPAADVLRPGEPRSGRLDPDLLHGLDRGEPNKRRQAPDVPAGELSEESAGPARRAGAAFIDAALAAAIGAVILRVTLGWMEFGWADWVRLPLVPLAGFLLLIIAGYLFVFTLASGQTPGKMLVGIRVVDDEVLGGPLTMSQALLRSLVALPAVLIAGLGFLPALIGDERALHDRVAHTRVVRA